MPDTINVTVYVRTKMVGSLCKNVIPVPRDEWESMSPSERDEFMLEAMFDMIEWGYDE